MGAFTSYFGPANTQQCPICAAERKMFVFPKLLPHHFGCSNKWFGAVLSHFGAYYAMQVPKKGVERAILVLKRGQKGVKNTFFQMRAQSGLGCYQ